VLGKLFQPFELLITTITRVPNNGDRHKLSLIVRYKISFELSLPLFYLLVLFWSFN